MRDFPSCFGETGVQVADSSSSSSNKIYQNLVTCIYQCTFVGQSYLITITWSKTLMGQGVNVSIDDSTNQCLCKLDLKPWLFSKRKGSKSLDVNSCKLDIHWDLSATKLGSGPEPLENFFVAFIFNGEIVLLLGDLRKEALKKTNANHCLSNAILVSKREHIFGKRVYGTKAQFCNNGQIHDLIIECDSIGTIDPCLSIRIDSKVVMQVKRLRWKFRGNQTILVDNLAIEIFWDVHSWLFGPAIGSAVFMFQTCLAAEKIWESQTFYQPFSLPWNYSQSSRESKSKNGLGFSLILYAWKNE